MNIDIKYKRLLEIFKEISKIPRNSKQEEKIATYISNFAKSLNLESTIDEYNNVIVKKEKHNKSKSDKKIIFQAHTDMVCEKTIDSKHNFETDPIEVVEKDGYFFAKNTTLGADDGIGVSYLLLLMEDNDIVFPETYFIFTTQEEVGMYGSKYLNLENLNADYMINLDIEEENSAIVGCAGGITLNIKKNITTININDQIYEMNINGLYGGHSGVDIGKKRMNSNYLAALILSEFNDIKLISYNGGTKHNVITNSTKVIFATKETNVLKKINKFLDTINFSKEDKNINITVNKINKKCTGIDTESSKKVISLITYLKQNVIDMNKTIPNLVESSGNIGIVNINDGNIYICESIRSNRSEMLEHYKNYNYDLAKKLGFDIYTDGEYPSWDYNESSSLLNIYINAYEKTHNNNLPNIYTIHAGLECGIIKEKLPNIDIIALGPDVENIHTTNEKLNIASCKKLLETLLEMIQNI